MATDCGRNEQALIEALQRAAVSDQDRAGVQLARRYAQLLDAALGGTTELATYAELGPKYLAALTALGLTLSGRGAKGGVPDAAPAASPLDELRSRRAQRVAHAG